MRGLGLILFSLFSFILLSACSNDTPTITKIDSTDEDPSQKPALIEKEAEVNDEEKKEMMIEFSLPNEQVLVNLNGVSILKQYLSSIENRNDAINKMILTPLEVPSNTTLYLLQFSCENNACSYLLLDQKDDGRSYLVADIAKFESVLPSPNSSKLLFTFSRTRNNANLPKNKLLVMDLEKWQTVPIQANATDVNVTDYLWPMEEAAWNDDDTITVTVPDVEEPSEQLLKIWEESEKNKITLELTIGE